MRPSQLAGSFFAHGWHASFIVCVSDTRLELAGRPEDSGIALQTVRELGAEFPIFGVCMGHQCIGQVFGGDVVRAPSGVMHGKTSPVHHKDSGLLKVSYMFACHVCKMLSAYKVLIRLMAYDLQAPPCHTLLALKMQALRHEAVAVACCSMSYHCLHHCFRLIIINNYYAFQLMMS